MTQTPSGELVDIEFFLQLIPGKHKSEKTINILSVDKVHLKSECVHGSIINGIREPILYSFALSSPPGHKINKKP